MKGFDYGNIKIQGLSGDLKDLFYSADSLSGSLSMLKAKDHSGFEIKQLSGDFVYTNTGAIIKKSVRRNTQYLIKRLY